MAFVVMDNIQKQSMQLTCYILCTVYLDLLHESLMLLFAQFWMKDTEIKSRETIKPIKATLITQITVNIINNVQ